MRLISASAAAALISDLIARGKAAPVISGTKITSLAMAGLFSECPVEGRNRRFDLDEVVEFAISSLYLDSPEKLDPLVYRVSVLPARPAPLFDTDGSLLRPHAGVDYRLDPSSAEFLGGFEMEWAESEENADRCADEGALLLASHKGYVHPGCVRRIKDWFPVPGSNRKGFVTEPVEEDIRKFVGKSGIWVDVPGGRENGFLVDNLAIS